MSATPQGDQSAAMHAREDDESPPPGTGKWEVQTGRSAFDDTPSVVLGLFAETPAQGWLDTQTPRLVLRCLENKTEAYINVGMRTDSDYPRTSSLNASFVRIRLDAQPPKKLEVAHSTDGKALFLPGAIGLIREMLTSDRLLFEFTPFNANPQTTTFDLRGLTAMVGPLQEACDWSTAPRPMGLPAGLSRFEATGFYRAYGLDRLPGGAAYSLGDESAYRYAVSGAPGVAIEVWLRGDALTKVAVVAEAGQSTPQEFEVPVIEVRKELGIFYGPQ